MNCRIFSKIFASEEKATIDSNNDKNQKCHSWIFHCFYILAKNPRLSTKKKKFFPGNAYPFCCTPSSKYDSYF